MNTDLIKVSVICITYNHEKYIRKCLDGFVMQKTNFRFEVIVHDDASTDRTAFIVKEYAEKYPNLFVPVCETENQYSQGKKFMPRLLEMACGRYIAYCEGDDFWIDEYKLQKQFDIMENNPNVSIVVGKVICCNEDGSPAGKVFPSKKFELCQSELINKEDTIKMILGGYPFQTSSYFTRKALRQNLYSREFVRYMNGDVGMIIEAFIEGDFYYINDVLSCYRLFSIGSWNQRFHNNSYLKKSIHYLRHYYGHIDFDRVTKSVYRCYIYNFIIKGIGENGYADKKMFNEIRKYFKIKAIDVLKKAGKRSFIKYLLTIVSPGLVKKIAAAHDRKTISHDEQKK